MADENNKILKIGKDLNPETSLGESIGIEKISLNFMKDIFRVLDRKIIQENNLNEFYETTFQELYEQGNEMFAVDVSDYKCIEIDYPEDLKLAEVEIKSIESP
jgi:choline kinase